MVFFYGGSTSYILCAVSLSRCYIIVKPFDAKKVTVKKCLIVAIVATVMALVWTIAPLLGWNEYTLEHGIKTELSQRRVEMERRIVKSVVVTILGFFMAWTPYGVSSFISAFSSTLTPPLVISLCAIFAKASVVWIPLLYISTSTQYKLKFVDLKDMEKTATSQGGGGDGQTQINSQTATTVRRTPQVQVEEPSNKHSQDFTAINDETNNKSAT
ncbi:unnamed protein product [Didymodactylos carnosus]|nr:unnamed protein product [Didymodactylos carnosus]CAF4203284.1 unnamed protein product [Didymodactylos carnosus]